MRRPLASAADGCVSLPSCWHSGRLPRPPRADGRQGVWPWPWAWPWPWVVADNDGKLKVTGLEPRSGDAMGGQIVLIRGQSFMTTTRTAKVYFGDQQGNVIRFRSDSELIVEAPGGKPDATVDVLVVFEPGGEITIPKGFTFKEKKGMSAQDLK
jgi:hypothetical protein